MKKLNYFQTRPKATEIDVDAYLERLGLKREEASLDFLKKLHFEHVHRIPFENLDIHYRQKILLDYKKIFSKIVLRGRGGFCYELNGLFYHLLSHLGFDCYVTSASMLNDEGVPGPPFDHMITIVRLGKQLYLADVGFGNAFSYPKLIKLGVIQMDYVTYWRFRKDVDKNIILTYSADASQYKTKYIFRLEEKQIIEFMQMCEYHQTSKESPFTQKKMITIKTPDGRVTLTDRNLKIQKLGETSEDGILNEDEFLSKLEQYFSISYEQLIPETKKP